MLASMLGSSFASRLMTRNSLKVESYMQVVFVISSASLLLPILTSVSFETNVVVCCLLLFYPLTTIFIFGTVLHSSFKCERGKYYLCWLYIASWLLYIWGLCGDLLAIHNEDEIPIYSGRGKKYHNELLQDSSQHLCLHCAVQCTSQISYFHSFWIRWLFWFHLKALLTTSWITYIFNLPPIFCYAIITRSNNVLFLFWKLKALSVLAIH